jgi:hypothetical protein
VVHVAKDALKRPAKSVFRGQLDSPVFPGYCYAALESAASRGAPLDPDRETRDLS